MSADDRKAAWREWARRQHSRGVAPEAAARIIGNIRALLAAMAPTVVVLYSGLPGEVDVSSLAAMSDHEFALTRTPADGGLTVHSWGAERERHPYGFEQPRSGSAEVPLDSIGVVLVPGLAFDRRGVRLGRGAGYYDEFFSRVPADIERIGVVPARLIVDRLPADPHDIPMTSLVSEAGVLVVD